MPEGALGPHIPGQVANSGALACARSTAQLRTSPLWLNGRTARRSLGHGGLWRLHWSMYGTCTLPVLRPPAPHRTTSSHAVPATPWRLARFHRVPRVPTYRRVPKKWNGPLQYEDKKSGQLMMLPSDLALLSDRTFKVGRVSGGVGYA